MENFNPQTISLTKYLFYTGKGGVGKTSTACATAVYLADSGKKVLLVSTDPASNLQDVFGIDLNNKGVPIKEVPNLVVANLDPIQAAAEYKASVIDPYRGKLPDAVLNNMFNLIHTKNGSRKFSTPRTYNTCNTKNFTRVNL